MLRRVGASAGVAQAGKTCDPVNLCDSFGVAAEAAARYVTCFRSCDEHATARHLR